MLRINLQFLCYVICVPNIPRGKAHGPFLPTVPSRLVSTLVVYDYVKTKPKKGDMYAYMTMPSTTFGKCAVHTRVVAMILI